jgi:CheY-like chemotaxis protein
MNLTEDRTLAGRRILVVEDDPAMSEILRLLLEDSGCDILTAATGQEALELAREQTIDLITLDLGLPGMDGRELLRRLRGDPQTGEIPIIVVTGMRYVPRSDERIEAVLQKPFDASELENTIRRLLHLPV